MALDKAGARVPESHVRSCSSCCLLWHQAQSPPLAPHPFEEEVVGRINRQRCMHSLLNHWETALERWTLLPHRHCQRYLWLQLNQMSVPLSLGPCCFSVSPPLDQAQPHVRLFSCMGENPASACCSDMDHGLELTAHGIPPLAQSSCGHVCHVSVTLSHSCVTAGTCWQCCDQSTVNVSLCP